MTRINLLTLGFKNIVYRWPLGHRLLCTTSNSNNYWDYSSKYGPEQWKKTWPLDKRQSPIDIKTDDVIYDGSLKELNIEKRETEMKVKNTGLNISFLAENNKDLIYSGGPLKHRYAFREMHFHWGEVHKGECELGCEHTIDGKKYSAEMHVVHWNIDLYGTEQEALQQEEGLAVLALFLDANITHSTNKEFQSITNMFRKVPYKHDQSSVQVSPYFMLPSPHNKYYTYPGSLTTPPLTENVTWVVFPQPVLISLAQLEDMSQNYSVSKNEEAKGDHFKRKECCGQTPTITNNYRPTQPSNERIVKSSFK